MTSDQSNRTRGRSTLRADKLRAEVRRDNGRHADAEVGLCPPVIVDYEKELPPQEAYYWRQYLILRDAKMRHAGFRRMRRRDSSSDYGSVVSPNESRFPSSVGTESAARKSSSDRLIERLVDTKDPRQSKRQRRLTKSLPKLRSMWSSWVIDRIVIPKRRKAEIGSL